MDEENVTAAVPILKTRCHYCSKFRHPREIIPIGGAHGAKMCWHCWGWHQRALKLLAGEIPAGCQRCGATFTALQGRAGSGDVRMYVHPKDGIYQVLCQICSDRYVAQRADLYRPTKYGHLKKV